MSLSKRVNAPKPGILATSKMASQTRRLGDDSPSYDPERFTDFSTPNRVGAASSDPSGKSVEQLSARQFLRLMQMAQSETVQKTAGFLATKTIGDLTAAVGLAAATTATLLRGEFMGNLYDMSQVPDANRMRQEYLLTGPQLNVTPIDPEPRKESDRFGTPPQKVTPSREMYLGGLQQNREGYLGGLPLFNYTDDRQLAPTPQRQDPIIPIPPQRQPDPDRKEPIPPGEEEKVRWQGPLPVLGWARGSLNRAKLREPKLREPPGPTPPPPTPTFGTNEVSPAGSASLATAAGGGGDPYPTTTDFCRDCAFEGAAGAAIVPYLISALGF